MKCSKLFAFAALVLTAFAGCGGGGGSSSSTPAAPTSKTVAIVLTQAWTDTGLAVTAGQQLHITSTGNLTWQPAAQCTSTKCVSTPAGSPWATCATELPPPFTAPGLACWSLIGKVGLSGTPFNVGSAFTLTATTAGEFFLGVNDNYYPDNVGAWTATINRL